MEHYGLEVEQSTITIFICLVPVVIDACVKLWVSISLLLLCPLFFIVYLLLFLLLCLLSLSLVQLFKFLPRLSPRVSNIFQEMKRH